MSDADLVSKLVKTALRANSLLIWREAASIAEWYAEEGLTPPDGRVACGTIARAFRAIADKLESMP